MIIFLTDLQKEHLSLLHQHSTQGGAWFIQ